jgi:hypothetical protein
VDVAFQLLGVRRHQANSDGASISGPFLAAGSFRH